MRTIWCLFYTVNDYNQSPQLKAWWGDKPSFDQLLTQINEEEGGQGDQFLVNKILTGTGGYANQSAFKHGGLDWSLERRDEAP